MNNLILFPSFIRVNDQWRHGGRTYRNVQELAETLSASDYRRAYEWDLRRTLREHSGSHSNTGGSAA